MRYLSMAVLAIFAAGCCGRCKEDQSAMRFHEDGRAKPVVALAAMIDTSLFEVPWSLSDEFTSLIYQKIARNSSIFIQSRDDFAIAANPFTDDLSWVKREFQEEEFAVFLELVEHNLQPTSKKASDLESANSLEMGIRIRVVDLRSQEPKIVLQEIVRESYYIPKSLVSTDYESIIWGSNGYRKTPLGIAHNRIAQEVAQRVSDYVLLAKSR